jgi:hypothetical protein
MPAGVVVLYTPRDEKERVVCYSLFSESYNFACKLVSSKDYKAINPKAGQNNSLGLGINSAREWYRD